MKLTRDAILAAPDLKPVPVEVPEWGGTVYVRPLTGAERGTLEAETIANKGQHLATIRQRLAVRCLCDETGARLFKDEDAEAMGAKSAEVLDRVLNAIKAASALGDEGVAAAGESSTGAPSAGSGSVSP